MEGNKEEAVKCVRIGKEALEAGDVARALKFLSKAQHLDPSLPVHSLLASASAAAAASPPQDPFNSSDLTATKDADKQDKKGEKAMAKAVNNKNRINTPAAGYTEEQVEIVRQIEKHKKDYYQILGLDKATCTVEDVRKAYRKLSLKVHPDKNKAPGSEDAFKAVSKAFQCLSDDGSRNRYDLLGSQVEDSSSHQHQNMRRRSTTSFYEDDEFDPDEIFRNFFFGGMAPTASSQFRTFHFRTGGGMDGARAHGHGSGPGANSSSSTVRMLIQMLPILILLLVNFLPSSDPIYSLSRSYQYDHKLQTPRGVTYHVKSPKFEQEYPYQSSERMGLEQRVEREYLGILSQNCRLELQRRQWGLSYQTPHCDLLQNFDTAA